MPRWGGVAPLEEKQWQLGGFSPGVFSSLIRGLTENTLASADSPGEGFQYALRLVFREAHAVTQGHGSSTEVKRDAFLDRSPAGVRRYSVTVPV